ncbi:hypothetical protein NQ314_010970 [Rhamnusium bicolor]|uniref:Sodium-dependent nutrient amino acid transporter 1 n=1 Tax=Rhamnusium bicolor TaxID=1586634 RepID=A0AAV8XN05_9CUCU|nr:hypothetical protein NQ314_010970 [Rhamnusium bicolor]
MYYMEMALGQFSSRGNVKMYEKLSPVLKGEVLKEIDDISDGIEGVKSSGKASYFLALFPYVIMIALLIRASTLEGAGDGMYYFIETDWNRLTDADVWYAAVTQCFFSLNVGFGSIIMFSSYNGFSHNINRDALVVTTLDTFTSLLSGVTIFGILGNLAHEMGVDPSEVLSAGGGTGLAFISYPDAISKFSFAPWLFAILFFFMLFVLGVGSLVALQSTLNTAFSDAFPNVKHWVISTCTAIACFFGGINVRDTAILSGGQYMLDLVDHFGGTFIIFVFAILEVTAVTWLYGIDNFCLDLEFMTQKKVGIYWRICWGILMPVLLIVIFIYFIATLQPLTYGVDNLYYPDGIAAIGWCILGAGVLQMLY